MMHFRCLLLAKIVSIYAFTVQNSFARKLGRVNFFDKFQVWLICYIAVFKDQAIFHKGSFSCEIGINSSEKKNTSPSSQSGS